MIAIQGWWEGTPKEKSGAEPYRSTSKPLSTLPSSSSFFPYQALHHLIQNIIQPSSASMLRNAVWSLSNFCRGKPQPDLELVRPALPILAQILHACPDTEVLQVKIGRSSSIYL